VAEVEEPILHDGLGQLVDSELLYQRGRAPRAKYIFKHALIQDAAYESLLKSTRQKYHLKVAQFLEERFIEDKEEHPELVAHHYTEAGSTERAVLYWRTAGERARAQSANLEAIAHLTTGIQMLLEQPENEERAHQELALQVSLGHANIVAKGHGSTGAEAAYARALALCEQLGDVSELVPTLFGLWRFYVVVRPLDETNDVALRIHRLAEEKQETELRVIAHYALGYTALCMGDLGKANLNLAEGIAQYEPSQRSMEVYKAAQDPGVACRAYLAITEWLRGYPEQAQRLIHESIECAEKLSDAFSLAYTLCFPGVFVSEFCGSDTKTDIEQGLEVATEGGFSLWVAFGKVQLLNLQFKDHPSDSTLNDLRNSILAIPKIGVHINTPYYMTLLARAYQQVGRIDDGLQVLEEAGLSIEARGERWWEVEIHRLKGELLLSQLASNADDAEACFEQALSIAQNQEAKSLELRAAMSLSRLWLQQSKQGKARDLLSPIYTWFAEGFDTADLVQAKALLEELR